MAEAVRQRPVKIKKRQTVAREEPKTCSVGPSPATAAASSSVSARTQSTEEAEAETKQDLIYFTKEAQPTDDIEECSSAKEFSVKSQHASATKLPRTVPEKISNQEQHCEHSQLMNPATKLIDVDTIEECSSANKFGVKTQNAEGPKLPHTVPETISDQEQHCEHPELISPAIKLIAVDKSAENYLSLIRLGNQTCSKATLAPMNANPYEAVGEFLKDITDHENDLEASAPPSCEDLNIQEATQDAVDQLAQINYEQVSSKEASPGEPTQSHTRKKSLILPCITNIQPYSECDLKGIYQNLQLENREALIKKFINEDSDVARHEFNELLQNYYRSRINQLSSHKDVQKLNEDVFRQVESAWEFESCTVVEEGICEDDETVEVKHEYKVANFRQDITINITKTMKQLREVIFETHSLHCYTSEMNRILVENYIQKVICSCPELELLSSSSHVSCSPGSQPPHLAAHVANLRSCISVLFAFQRRELQDQLFISESRRWLTDLVSVLLRLATFTDHCFLLQHVMRAPRGVAEWAVSFIQVIPPCLPDRGQSNRLLDHSLAVLATLLGPVPARAEFLNNLRPRSLHPTSAENHLEATEDPPPSSCDRDDLWVVMDSDGEEQEEDVQLTWSQLNEQDIVDLLHQVPLEAMFRQLLQLPLEGSVEDQYSITAASPHSLLRLFAFCTELIAVLRTGLNTYSSNRFKDLRRRLCRIIRHVLHHVSDHWSNYLHYHLYNPSALASHDSAPPCATDTGTFPSTNLIWSRLQVEFDEMFGRAVHTIVTAPKCWQFLAVIPYTALSLHRLWAITYELHTGKKYTDPGASHPSTAAPSEGWASLLRHHDTQGRFRDRILTLAQPEAFYLLTTFGNMASSRPRSEADFIEVVVCNVFELSVLCEQTRDLCCKSGRDLLAAVATKHPDITLATLLKATQENLSSVGVNCLLLFRQLPLALWRPSSEQLHSLLYWLAHCPASSHENVLARLILGRLNWGFTDDGGLALPSQLHLQVALGVVCACVRAEDVLGLTPIGSGRGGLLVDSVKTVTAAVCAVPPEQQLVQWCWQQLSVLRLHRLDWSQQLADSGDGRRSPTSSLQAAALLQGVPDATHTSLMTVRTALLENRPIALFLALLSTTWGHSIPEVCEEGVSALQRLCESGHYSAAVTALGSITPLLWHSPHTLTTDEKFIEVLRQILDADQTYYQRAMKLVLGGSAGPVLRLLHAMIHSHIVQHSRFGVTSATTPALFWVQLLTSVPGWTNHHCVLHVLDGICRLLHRYPAAHSNLSDLLWEQTKNAAAPSLPPTEPADKEEDGTAASMLRPITSLFSWFSLGGSGGAGAPSLLSAPAAHLPWYTLLVLRLDTRWEDSTGLWKELLKHLDQNPDAGLDAALTAASSARAVGCSPSLNSLALYRWGQQVLGLAVIDPAFLITLQCFFTRHLARGPANPLLDYACGSVISRFYEGLVNSNFLNKIKNKVNEALEHFKAKEFEEKKRIRKEEMDDIILQMEDEVYDNLPRLKEYTFKRLLLASMKAWLSDERLYRRGVFLGSLPPALNPIKLADIVQENWEPWEDAYCAVDDAAWSEELLDNWVKHRCQRSCGANSRSNSTASSASSSRSCTPETAVAVDGEIIMSPTFSEPGAPLPSAPPASIDTFDGSLVNYSPDAGTGANVLSREALGVSTGDDSRSLMPPASVKHIASISKRLTEYDTPLPPPPLPSRSSLSPPNSPSLGLIRGAGNAKGLDRITLVSEIRNYYIQVMKHAEEIVSRWREMCSGDCLILDMLPQLYSNVERRVVRRKECVPPPPPRGQPERACAGKATLVLEFCEQQRNEGVSVKLEHLVGQRKLLLQQSCAAPPLQVCTAAAAIDTLITLLVQEYREVHSGLGCFATTDADGHREQQLWESGWQLFWHVVSQATQENYYYPPAKQLTAATAALLGQEFVSGVDRCQEELLDQVFRLEEAKGSLIAPHFSPLAVPQQHIIHLYKQLTSYAASNQDIVFMMLSKFDFGNWTMSDAEAASLLSIVSSGMHQLLGLRDRDVSLAFGMYRVHWCALLHAHFHSLYGPTLSLLLGLSHGCGEEPAALLSHVWFDLLNLMVMPARVTDPEGGTSPVAPAFSPALTLPEMINVMRKLLQTEIWLTSGLVKETIGTVSAMFHQQRAEQALYGLYPVYRHLALPIGLWGALTSHALICFSQLWPPQKCPDVFESVWCQQESLWSHWVYPFLTQGRTDCPMWVLDMVGDKRYLQPWSPADAPQANTLLTCYSASLSYFHQTWRGRRCVLSRVLQRYCSTMADREVKDHVLTLLHTHLLSALPWHHLTPTIQHLTLMSKIINKYLPECHSFLGHVLVQVPWATIVREAVAAHTPTNDGVNTPKEPSDPVAATLDPVKLHALLLNLLVRISMEPSVRQCGPLHSLLADAESFHWELLDAASYEQLLNWYVLSCDPRVVLPLPGRSSVDSAVIHLLHVAANYTPECGAFHRETGRKRVLLAKTLVRLLTSSAARHKALLATQPGYFAGAYKDILTHLEDTVQATVAASDGEEAARPLCVELLAAVGHGAASPLLQEVCRGAVMEWALEATHPSPTVVCSLLWAACRGVLQMQHRILLLHALISAALHSQGLGLRWSKIVSLLSFMSTNPAPMIMQAAQEGQLLAVYGYLLWLRTESGTAPVVEEPQLLQALLEGLATTAPSASCEKGFLLVLSEVLEMISQLVARGVVVSTWQSSSTLAQLLAGWEEDRRSTGLLGSIGLGPRSDVSTSVRVMCRSVRAFLLAQLIAPGVFCSVNEAPLSAAATTDTPPAEVRSSGASLSALSGVLNLRSNSLYSAALPALEQAVHFIQDPGRIVTDVTKLFALLLQHFYETDPVLGHLTQVTATGRFKYNVMRKVTGPTNKSGGKGKQSPGLHHENMEIDRSEEGSFEVKEFVNGGHSVETENQFENGDDDMGEESSKRSKKHVLINSSDHQDFKFNDEVSVRLKRDTIDLLATDSLNNCDEQLQEKEDRSAQTTTWANEHQDYVSPSAPSL